MRNQRFDSLRSIKQKALSASRSVDGADATTVSFWSRNWSRASMRGIDARGLSVNQSLGRPIFVICISNLWSMSLPAISPLRVKTGRILLMSLATSLNLSGRIYLGKKGLIYKTQSSVLYDCA